MSTEPVAVEQAAAPAAPKSPAAQAGADAGASVRKAVADLFQGDPSYEEQLFTSPQMAEGGQQIKAFLQSLLSDLDEAK